MKIGRLIARIVIGGLFVGHGTQKWLGWFGGPGLEGASKSMESLGLRPGRRNAVAASASETIGGALLASGTLTPLAASTLIATMITAIRTVHLKNGPWSTNGGYEYNLVLIAAHPRARRRRTGSAIGRRRARPARDRHPLDARRARRRRRRLDARDRGRAPRERAGRVRARRMGRSRHSCGLTCKRRSPQARAPRSRRLA